MDGVKNVNMVLDSNDFFWDCRLNIDFVVFWFRVIYVII